MARLAYRRPVTKADTGTLLDFFDNGRQDGGSFDSGIQFALERMLVDPDFLLRVYRDPAEAEGAAATYRINDLDLASRLSFFLWSSIPDDRLLALAEHGELQQSRRRSKRKSSRMLADPRATDALVNNFAAQWLNLRRVEEVVVDPIKYPLYDESLLQAFQTETEMFVASTIARRPQRQRSAERRLHFRQREARAALRDSRSLRQPLPPCDAAQPRSARRIAGARRAAGDHLLSRPHVAGAARQMAAEQYLWPRHAAAPSRRERHARNQARRGCPPPCAKDWPSTAPNPPATVVIR